MQDLLEPFRPLSRPAFILAGLLFVPVAIVLGLMAPLFALVIFFIGAGFVGPENAPDWAPFATVSLQTIAHLLLAAVMPAAVPQVAEESTHQPSIG